VRSKDIFNARAELSLLDGSPAHGHIRRFKSRYRRGVINTKRITAAGVDAVLFHHGTSGQGKREGSLLKNVTQPAIERWRLHKRYSAMPIIGQILSAAISSKNTFLSLRFERFATISGCFLTSVSKI
jgi:hypothetical protein